MALVNKKDGFARHFENDELMRIDGALAHDMEPQSALVALREEFVRRMEQSERNALRLTRWRRKLRAINRNDFTSVPQVFTGTAISKGLPVSARGHSIP